MPLLESGRVSDDTEEAVQAAPSSPPRVTFDDETSIERDHLAPPEDLAPATLVEHQPSTETLKKDVGDDESPKFYI